MAPSVPSVRWHRLSNCPIVTTWCYITSVRWHRLSWHRLSPSVWHRLSWHRLSPSVWHRLSWHRQSPSVHSGNGDLAGVELPNVGGLDGAKRGVGKTPAEVADCINPDGAWFWQKSAEKNLLTATEIADRGPNGKSMRNVYPSSVASHNVRLPGTVLA